MCACFVLFLQSPEFIFPVEARSRSWNEIWFNRVGCGYFIGLGVGGLWGVKEGLLNPEASTYRMRANSLLNGLTRRGPFMANTLGVLSRICLSSSPVVTLFIAAMAYSPLESCICHFRGKKDLWNSVVAAAITGALYKSTGLGL